MRFDIITVVYDQEIYLLEWQAKSIAKYVPSEAISNIFIVDNGSQTCHEKISLDWYGVNQHKVVFLNHGMIGFKPYDHLDGWRTQQLCKLLSASRSQQEWTCILDAKTFFCKIFEPKDIFDRGRPRVGSIEISHFWNDAKLFVEDFFNINLPGLIGPGGVPFFIHSQTVRDMISSIPNFNNWFQDLLYEQHPPHRLLITEFILYSAYVVKKFGSYDKLYSAENNICPFNVSDWEADKFERIFSADAHTISVAEKTKRFLTTEQLKRWELFLYEKYN